MDPRGSYSAVGRPTAGERGRSPEPTHSDARGVCCREGYDTLQRREHASRRCASDPGGAKARSATHTDLRSDWASVALSWIANCPFRHLCNRSVQVFRALKVPVMQQTLADILARLSETVGSARDEGSLGNP